MSEELGLHAKLTASAGNTVSVMDQLLNKLFQLEQKSKLLKKSQKEIEKEIENATQRYGENSRQVKRLNDDLNANYRVQKQLKDEIKQVNSAIKQQTNEYKKNAQESEKTASGTQKIKNGINLIKAAILSYAGKTLYEALIGSNAQFEQSITSFEVLLGSYDKAQSMMENLNNFGAKTPFELPDVTEATEQLLAFGVAEENVMATLQQLGDLSKGNAEILDRVTAAYGKMLAKGKVSLEELNMLTEAGIPILKELANQYGVSQEKLFQMISAGEVNITGINKAMTAMTSEGGQFFGMMEKQSKTMQGTISTLSDNINMAFRDVGEESFEYLKSELQDILNTIDEMNEDGSMDAITSGLGETIGGIISSVGNFLGFLWEIREAIIAVGGAFVLWKTWEATLNGISAATETYHNVLNTLKGLKEAHISLEQINNVLLGKSVILRNTETGAITLETAAKAKEILATEGATAAQVKFNAAILRNPYVLAATLLFGVSAAFLAFGDAEERANKKAEEAKKAYEETKTELGSVEKQLEETGKRIDELNAKDKLSFAEKSELENLKATNKELSTRLILLKEEEKRKAQEANTAIENRNKQDFLSSGDKQSLYETVKVTGAGMTYEVGKSITEEEYFNEAIRKTEELLSLGDKRTEQQDTELKKLREYISDAGKRYQQDADGYVVVDEQTEKTKQHWLDMADAAAKALDPELWKQIKFDEVFNADNFADCKEQLIALSQTGEITPTIINSYQEFQDLMNETGITAEDIAGCILAASDDIKNSVTESSDVLSSFTDKVDDIQSKINTLNSIQSSYNQTGHITADMLQTITDNDLLEYLEFANGKLIINKDALLNDAQAAKEKATADTQASLASNILAIIQEDTKRATDNAGSALAAAKTDTENFDAAARNAAIGAAVLAEGMSAVYSAYSGEIGEGGLSQDAQNKIQEAIANAQKVIGAINSVKVDSISSSARSGNASREAEQERKAKVKAYEEAIAEEMRLDERWNKRKKLRDEISEEDYLWNIGNRADTYRKYADEVLTIDYMTAEEQMELRQQYLEKAEDLDDEYLKSYQESSKKQFESWLQDAESYRSDREFYNDWGEDSEEEFLQRVISKIEQAKNEGVITAQEYYDYLSQYMKEFYTLGKEQYEEYVQQEEKRLKEKYQTELKLEKEAINKASELKQKQYDKELERLDELQKKRKEQQEDDADNLQMERLQNKLEYEVDADNRNAIQKEIDKLQESIDEKNFNREIEEERESIQKAKEEEIEAAQKKIDRITKYYESKMSGVNIANEILQSIDPVAFEGIGDVIGDNIAKGMQNKINGMISGIKETLAEISGIPSRSYITADAKSNNTTITINQTNNGVSTPYQQNIGIKKVIKDIETGVY